MVWNTFPLGLTNLQESRFLSRRKSVFFKKTLAVRNELEIKLINFFVIYLFSPAYCILRIVIKKKISSY